MNHAVLAISLLSAVFMSLVYAIPYFVEVLDVDCRGEARFPVGYSLTVTVAVRNNAPLNVGVRAVLTLRCTLMDGSQETYSYPFDPVTVKPYSTEVLETTVSFGFTTPENPKAIYKYSADLMVIIEGPVSTRTIEVRSIETHESNV